MFELIFPICLYDDVNVVHVEILTVLDMNINIHPSVHSKDCLKPLTDLVDSFVVLFFSH